MLFYLGVVGLFICFWYFRSRYVLSIFTSILSKSLELSLLLLWLKLVQNTLYLFDRRCVRFIVPCNSKFDFSSSTMIRRYSKQQTKMDRTALRKHIRNNHNDSDSGWLWREEYLVNFIDFLRFGAAAAAAVVIVGVCVCVFCVFFKRLDLILSLGIIVKSKREWETESEKWHYSTVLRSVRFFFMVVCIYILWSLCSCVCVCVCMYRELVFLPLFWIFNCDIPNRRRWLRQKQRRG